MERAFAGLEAGPYAALVMAFDAFVSASDRSARKELKRSLFNSWLKLANAPAYQRCKLACEVATAAIARTWKFINERLAYPDGRLAAYRALFEEERLGEADRSRLESCKLRLRNLEGDIGRLEQALVQRAAKRAHIEVDIKNIVNP